MHKTITIILVTLSLILILDSMNAGHAITMFILAGIVPGTNIVISATQMLEVFSLLLGFALARIAVRLTQLYFTYRASEIEAIRSNA